MKKNDVLTILGVLFIGIAPFLIFSQPESPAKETVNQAAQQNEDKDTEDAADEPEDEEETNEDTTSGIESEEPVTQLQVFLNQAVHRTIDFFTNKEASITAIGDSLTQGVGDDVVEDGYVGILDNQINKNTQVVSFENYGKRGNRSDQLLERLDQPEIAQSIDHADMVLITIGANDIMQVVKENVTNLRLENFTPAKRAYKDRLQQIFDKLTNMNPDTEIYLVGVYNPFLNYFADIEELDMIVDDWNQTSRDVADQYENVTFIPIADLFESGDYELFADDHFHPSHRGYQLLAKRVLDYLTDS
ncbi:SGNH/GDSL hydrolase family protein [Lentibacillus salinarum]|uniref:SGNH/GDSL hydrolase family protein n=1 Tax=Lentibacillus salinarum TaxID=446820 RepID=A0ABW3ZZQ2_9BACI